MINIQGCHQTINIVAGDKDTFLLKELSQTFSAVTERRHFHIVIEEIPLLQSRRQHLLYPLEVPDL
jgi:hypothetical protein